MVDPSMDALHSHVAEHFGDALRSVAGYDEEGLDVRYMRDDVASLYDEADHGRVFRNLRLEAMDHPTQESLFAHDDLQSTYRVYDGAIEVHIAVSETTGVLVSLDDDADVDLRVTTDRLLEALERSSAASDADPRPGDEASSTDAE
ncbi:hypothetical protein [Halovivax cerinus]|uniref:Halobacterial output domain-containing protein n=1 Tax=Halovivax cerinus TaxID=1487865 RepID=A0ABD5NNB8_9EURY|nr:hypothetical protein [Halovivax cerinus]